MKLQNVRKKCGLTQYQVAIYSNISQPYYQKIESGDRTPSIKVAKKIAHTLKIDWLLLRPDIKKEIKSAGKLQ